MTQIPKRLWVIFGCLLATIFLIQSNLAWLNPRPGFEPLVKLSQAIPVLWQYNTDSITEFFTASAFPGSLKDTNIRVSRPAYPFLVRLLQEDMELFFHLTVPYSTALAYLLLKGLVYLLYCVLFLKLLRYFLDERTVLLALILSLFHRHAITYIATYQTTELQFITPLIVAFLLWDISKSYTLKKNVLYSAAIGFLMMAKPDYAVYLAVLTFSVYKGRYKEAGISLVSYLVPLGVWLLFLKFYGVPYYDNQAALYGQGIWLYRDFLFMPLKEMVTTVLASIKDFGGLIFDFYGFWVFVGALGLIFYARDKSSKKLPGFFLLLLIFWTWVQFFAARHYVDYMASDFSFLVWGAAAYLVFKILPFRSHAKSVAVTSIIAVLTLTYHVSGMVNLPWLHPYEQHVIYEAEFTELDAYRATHPTETLEFLPQRIVNRVPQFLQSNAPEEMLNRFFVANGWVTHDIPAAFAYPTEECRVYRFDSPYIIIHGSLAMDNPTAFKRVEFSINEAEWYPVPLREEVTLDYTMYRLGFHRMDLLPAGMSPSWGGYSYLIYIDKPLAVGDFITADYSYDFVLYEDDVPLPMPHATADDIIAKGMGRYMLRGDGMIIFSSSDNSDPRTNGRKYRVSYTAYSFFVEPFATKSYLLRFCPNSPDDASFESGVGLKTLFQYNRAMYPRLEPTLKK